MFFKQSFCSVVLLCSLINITSADNYAATNSGISYATQKSMDPAVWSEMMSMMMDPSKMSSASDNCALCHEDEVVARYEEQFGPMMDATFNMYKAMNPQQMMAMMGPMMNMMNPMMMSMMGPMMGMMNPMMMGPMMGMMNPMMMGGMNPMAMMGGMNPMQFNGNTANNTMNMMNPEQYEQWFNQMTEMMSNFAPKAAQ